MSTLRRCVLIVLLAAIGVAVAHLRVEQARCRARIIRTEGRWLSLRGQLGDLLARKARLRTPDRLRRRNYFFDTGLVPPGATQATRPDRLAATYNAFDH